MKTQSAIRLNQIGVLALVFCWNMWGLRAATVAWYRFEEGGTNYSMVTNIVDSGTNDLHGLASPPGVLRYAPAKQAYPIGGASALALFGLGLATLPNPAGIDLEHGFTIELLIRAFEDVPDPTQWHTILTKRASDDPQSDVTLQIEYKPLGRAIHIWCRLRGENGHFSVAGNGGEGELVRSPNGWNHPVLTFSRYENGPAHGYDVDVIMDGAGWVSMGGTADLHADLGTGPFQLGGGFYGLVDEFRVSNVALERSDMLVDFPHQELVATILPKVEITFPTYRWNYYDVEWTQDVNTGVWQHLEPTGINGTGFPITVVDPGGFGQQRFYRVHEFD